MKYKLLLFLLLFVLAGCDKTEVPPEPQIQQPKAEVPLPKLKRPAIILNDLAKADFQNGNITYIDMKNSSQTNCEWRFKSDPKTNRPLNISIVRPPYMCETTEMKFQYRDDGFIDEIVSVRANPCAEFTSRYVYKYNYEDNLLVSIIATNYFTSATSNNRSIFICENFFSYYPNGKVHEIYSSFRETSQSDYGYQKKTLKYDENGNVIEVIRQEHHTNQYDEKYTFEYDNNLNPLKGIYIISSVQAELPAYGYASSLGPRFLSTNCIKSVKSEYLYHSKPPRIDYFDSKTVSNRVVDFGYRVNDTDWMRYFIKY